MNLRFLFPLTVALAGGYALYASLSWSFRTALFPRLLGVSLLFLAIIEVVLSVSGLEKQREGHAVDFQLSGHADPEIARKRTLAIFAWILAFLALILLVGFPLAVPLFVFSYLKAAGKEGWVSTLLLTGLAWLFMKGLFDWLLHLPFPEGWLLPV